jgi:hypothetical protein
MLLPMGKMKLVNGFYAKENVLINYSTLYIIKFPKVILKVI